LGGSKRLLPTYLGVPGPLSEPLWVVPGRSQGHCGVFLGYSQGFCQRSWVVLGPLWAVLDRLGSALRCYVCGLGPLLGPMFAVLGLMLAVLSRCWGRCWQSWRLLEPLLVLLRSVGLRKKKNMCSTLTMYFFPSGSAICSLGDGHELLLGLIWVVLGRMLLGPMLAVPGRS